MAPRDGKDDVRVTVRDDVLPCTVWRHDIDRKMWPGCLVVASPAPSLSPACLFRVT